MTTPASRNGEAEWFEWRATHKNEPPYEIWMAAFKAGAALSERPFIPTHVHADGGRYRLVTGSRYKTAQGTGWSDCIIYEAENRKLYVTTPARWTDRFAPLDSSNER